MLRRTSAVAVAATLAATLGAVGAAGAAQPDSYYPSKGNPGVDVHSYALDLTWRPGKKLLVGTATIELETTAVGGSFTLDLHKRMAVRSVTVDGTATPYRHDGQDLTVKAALVPGTPHTLVVSYRGKPTTVAAPTTRADDTGLGWHTTSDGRVWTMQKPFGAFTWYPVNDHPSDKARYDVRLDVPEDWVGVSNGRLQDRTTAKGRTVTHFVNAHPMASYLVTVAIGPYKKYTQTGPGGLPMTYWVPKGRKELLKPLLKSADTLRWLQKRLGRYPFDRAGVVVTPGRSSVESQTMITLAADNYRYGNDDVREQVAHDLAHAWWGDTVTPDDWSDLWMSEGVATWLQAKYAVAQGWDTGQYWRREFRRNDGYWRELYGPPGAYDHHDFGQRNVHYCTAYMLNKLRGRIGAADFNEVLEGWPQENLDRTRGRGAFVDFVETVSGQELSRFFDDWLTSPTTPTS